MLPGGKGRTLKTTRTSLRVLELIIDHEGLTLAELNRSIDKPKSTVHSHVHTLLNCRYLVEDNGVYTASFRLSVLGDRARRSRFDTERTGNAVEQLAETTGEEANFTVLEHGRLLVAHSASRHTTTERRETGLRTEYYLHDTAAGKAILARMDRGSVERVLDSVPNGVEAPLGDRERLFDSLEGTADRGYGVFEGESSSGLVAVGVPVCDNETVIGGLSVGGPKYRVSMDRLHTELADALLETAARLEEVL